MRRRLLLLAVSLGLAGCGYFNSLYNANSRFADAERAATRGDQVAARRAYNDAIEKAAVSYRRYPDSRWADDALLLLGRARFALAQDERVAAAMSRLLRETADEDVRAAAHAYLGAALFRLDRADSAIAHLDSAALRLRPRSELGSFALLWRARAAFDQGRAEDAWADLERAAASADAAFEVGLEAATRATELGDSIRFAAALDRVARGNGAGASADVFRKLLRRAALRWSPATAFRASRALEDPPWRPVLRDSVAITRAQLAAEGGDTAAAVRLAEDVARSVSGGLGSEARLLSATLRLATAIHTQELEDVRVLLLGASENPDAVRLMRRLRAAQLLIDAADRPDRALSLFAAAELVRDDLRAPRLARGLFLEFASLSPDADWAGKALLAAHLIEADSVTELALASAATSVYVRAATGAPVDDELTAAEERLARGLSGLRADALAEAAARDVVIGRRGGVADSSRAAVPADTGSPQDTIPAGRADPPREGDPARPDTLSPDAR